jgi:hypothetical protein
MKPEHPPVRLQHSSQSAHLYPCPGNQGKWAANTKIEAGVTGLDSTLLGLTQGKAKWVQRRSQVRYQKRKKEEFPGIMGNMLPGNSFPQICVVTVLNTPYNQGFAQDYGRSIDLSNTLC